MKECRECKVTKDVTEFHKKSSSKDGLNSLCKDCRSITRKKHGEDTKEHQSKVRKAYRERNKERVSEQKKRAYKKHKVHILQRVKTYRERNRESVLEYGRNHYLENKHIYIAHSQKRKDRLKDGINDDYMDRLKELYYVSTAISNGDIKYQVDHIIPLTHPDVCGLHVPWNMQLLTEDENKSKKNKFDGTYNNEAWR